MDGVVEDKATGEWTELRVHGVGGGSAEELLGHPHPRLVAGDATAGFYRQWDHRGTARQDTQASPAGSRERPHREAYVWGGVTSGSAAQALWLLLLPFMLVNASHWMQPGTVTDDGRWQARLRPVLRALGRLLALSLTLTLVLAVAQASMDLAAWQCGGPGRACGQQQGYLRFLSSGVWSQPGRRAVVGAAVPALVIGLLWWLSRVTGQRYERRMMPADTERLSRPLELERREFWNGGRPVAQLRNLHVLGAFALLAILTVSPGVQHAPSPVGTVLLSLGALGVLASVVAVCFPHHRNLTAAERDPAARGWRALVTRSLPWVGIAVLAGSAAYSAVPRPGSWVSDGALPGLYPVLAGTFVAQVGLLTLLLVTTLALAALERARLRRERPAPAADTAPDAPDMPAPPPAAFKGLGTPVAAITGWGIAWAFSAGLAFRVADVLSRPHPQTSAETATAAGGRLLVPAPYYWAALSVVLLLAAAVVIGVVLLLRAVRTRRALEPVVREAAGLRAEQPRPATWEQADQSTRARTIARAQAWASLTDAASLALGWLASAAALLVLVGIVGYLRAPSWATDGSWGTVTTFGSWLVGAFALALVGLGQRAYRNQTIRRTVGILWDVGSFWPRELHPLAPPSYCERIIPDLVERIGALTRNPGDRVVLATHSQGTVIGAATLLQLAHGGRLPQLALITAGSPLRRLYARYFPAYFGHQVFACLGQMLTSAPDRDPGGPPRPEWCWRNLYRLTDPIGGWVVNPPPAPDRGGPAGIDRRLGDPVFSKPQGDTVYPPIHGHFDYFLDPAYDQAFQRMLTLRE